MFKWSFVLCAFLALLGASATSAQETAASSNSAQAVNGGTVNGKALTLIQPAYPPAARAVRATGSVDVQVTIDENGDVISAVAVSGHPLLRAAAAQAARASKFKPTQFSGKPVKVMGIIVYNFFADKMNFAQIGFELAKAQFLIDLGDNYPAYLIGASLPDEWTGEKQQAERLVAKLRQARTRAPKAETSENQPSNTEQRKVVVKQEEIPFIAGARVEEITESQAEIATKLVQSVKERLASNEKDAWLFSLGLAVGKIKAESKNDAKLRANLRELNQVVALAPADISNDFLIIFKDLANIADKAEIEADDKAKIAKAVIVFDKSGLN